MLAAEKSGWRKRGSRINRQQLRSKRKGKTMIHNTGSFGFFFAPAGSRELQEWRRVVSVGLVALVLFFGAVFGVVKAFDLSPAPETPELESSAVGQPKCRAKAQTAHSARWKALGEHYAPNYAAVASTNSARWTALEEYYTPGSGPMASINAIWWGPLVETDTDGRIASQ
jgi:hypothetical protein